MNKLARWLRIHRPHVWQELGQPSLTFSKEDPRKGRTRRVSQLMAMNRLMPLNGYQRELRDNQAQKLIHRHRRARFLAGVFLVMFIAGVALGALFEI